MKTLFLSFPIQIENLDCKITEDEAFNRSLELEPRK